MLRTDTAKAMFVRCGLCERSYLIEYDGTEPEVCRACGRTSGKLSFKVLTPESKGD